MRRPSSLAKGPIDSQSVEAALNHLKVGRRQQMQHVARMNTWFLVQVCNRTPRLVFVPPYERLILKCQILAECGDIPGGSRPHGYSHRWFFSPLFFFYLHSTSFGISQSTPHTAFNLTPLALGNIYVHLPPWWVYWYVTLIVIAV